MRSKDLDREVRSETARFYAAGREPPGAMDLVARLQPDDIDTEVVTRDEIEAFDYLFGTNTHAGREVLRRLRPPEEVRVRSAPDLLLQGPKP